MTKNGLDGISVIIPSRDGFRDGNLPKLLESINKQTVKPDEVKIVKGESPCSRAHNVGAKEANYEMLIFFDDDIALDSKHVIENLVGPFSEYPNIGISGASQKIPPDANRFQKRYAAQMQRAESEVVDEMVDSDMATHAGMAISRRVFFEVGGENENLIRGDDPELRHRVRKAGYRIVVVPNTWVYHPPPRSLKIAIKSSFINGMGTAHDYLFDPDLLIEVPEGHKGEFVPTISLSKRILRAILNVITSLFYGKDVLLITNVSRYFGQLYGFLYYRRTKNNSSE